MYWVEERMRRHRRDLSRSCPHSGGGVSEVRGCKYTIDRRCDPSGIGRLFEERTVGIARASRNLRLFAVIPPG